MAIIGTAFQATGLDNHLIKRIINGAFTSDDMPPFRLIYLKPIL